MGKIKSILAALVLFSVPAIWSVIAQAAGNFGLESVTVLDKSTNVVADTPTVSGNTITSTIVFHELNDYVKYNLTLKNSTTTSYKIIDITDNNSNILIDYTYDNHADEVINAGGSLNLELTITYIQAHQDANDRTQNNNVKFTISYLDLHTGTVEDDEIILVPNTGENTKEIVASNFVPGIVTFVIIFAGVVLVAAILYKKKGIAIISVLAIVITTTGALNMGAVAEDYIDLNANLNSEIRLRDYFAGIVRYKDDYTGDDIFVNLADVDELIPYDADDPWLFSEIFMGTPLSFFTAPGGLVGVGVQFTGTNIDVNLDDPIMDDFDITIVYGEQPFGITYDYNGGTVATANPTTVKGSDAPFTLNTPTKDGSTFFCWTGTDISGCEQEYTVDPSNVSGDLEYTANYVHEITILDQNGAQLGYTVVQEAHGETTYSSDTFYTNGYHISGGSCTNNQHLGVYNNGSAYVVEHVNRNTVCTVTTVPNTYSVELVVNNGVGSDSQTVDYSANAVFTGIAANTDYTLPRSVSCTNSQTATINDGTVTVNNVTDDTVCTVNALPPTIHTITYMQEMTPEICAATTTPSSSLETGSHIDWNGSHYGDSNYIPRTTLIDNRDNQKYVIEKLADGECWMMQNLSLVLSTDTRFTSENTDLNTISSYTPIRNTENIIVNVQNPYGEDKQALYTAQLSWYPEFPYFVGTEEFPYNGVTPSDSPTDDSDEYLWQKTGNLYSASAVTAGTYTFAAGTDFYTQDTICPKGWTLPDNALIDPNGTNPPNDRSLYKLMYTYSPNNQSTDYLHFAESGIFSQTFGGYYQSHQGAGMSGFSTMDGVKHYTGVAYLGDYFRDAYGTGRSNPFILNYARFLMPNYPYVQIQTINSNVLTYHGAYARCIAR